MKFLAHIIIFLCCTFSLNAQITYVENFDAKGMPTAIPNNSYWKYFNDIYPPQDSWDKFIPGDGFAYIKVDADIHNDTDYTYPYQTLVFGGATENHRIEVRMKGAVVDGGLVGFLFTYAENSLGTHFNEVDIEVVGNDRDVDVHETLPPNGWTDARFNTWKNASTKTFLPISGSAKPVKDANNNSISLIDDNFHTYTIDWRTNQVDFFIDGVMQASFNTNVAAGWGEVIIGYRNLPWARPFNWTGEHNLVIDYFKVEFLNTLADNSYNLEKNDVSVFPNPAYNQITIASKNFYNIQKIDVVNSLGKKVLHIDKHQYKVDINELPTGLYLVNTYFDDGSLVSKKLLKR